METTQIVLLFCALLGGVVLGALLFYLLFGRKTAAEFEERAKHEFELQRTKLETERAHLEKTAKELAEKAKAAEAENDELLKKLSAAETNLNSVTGRFKELGEERSAVETQLNERIVELNKLGSVNAQITANLESAHNNLIELKTTRQTLEKKVEELSEANASLQSRNATLSANFEALQERLETQKQDIEDIRKKSHLEFENIAAKILETKSEKFTQTNRDNIQKLLDPLNKEIGVFKAKVEETYDKESKERFSLGEKVRELIETTDKVSAEANNLAAALKGQAKKIGDWGEVILERILEVNGLTRGREYDVQHSIKSADGAQQYLDVIVHLPDDRKLIIDSKVSLNAYERYCSAETEEDRARCLQDHLRSVSTHIDQLSAKKYDDMDSAADFVMMFVPIEPAYLVALQHDLELSKKAFAKRVLLISPTSLMIAVKMVSDLWKRDQQSKNALEIANQGQKLYDKFVGFINSMQEVGTHLDRSRESYDKALGQLKNGRGNLVSQAEKLKELGVKTSKALPAAMEDYERDDDSRTIIEVNPRQI